MLGPDEIVMESGSPGIGIKAKLPLCPVYNLLATRYATMTSKRFPFPAPNRPESRMRRQDAVAPFPDGLKPGRRTHALAFRVFRVFRVFRRPSESRTRTKR